MREPTSASTRDRLAVGYALAQLWGETMGLPSGDSKERPLPLIAEILDRERVPYALIGGVAVQVHTEEPRSTLPGSDHAVSPSDPGSLLTEFGILFLRSRSSRSPISKLSNYR